MVLDCPEEAPPTMPQLLSLESLDAAEEEDEDAVPTCWRQPRAILSPAAAGRPPERLAERPAGRSAGRPAGRPAELPPISRGDTCQDVSGCYVHPLARALLLSLYGPHDPPLPKAAAAALEARAATAWVFFGDPNEHFEARRAIGEGCYGSVYRVRERRSGRAFAAKRVFLEADSVVSARNEVVAHVAAGGGGRVCALHRVYLCGPTLWLVLELAEASLLDVLLVLEMPLTEEEIRCVLSEALLGLRDLHRRGFVHRDVKCSNLLLTAEGDVKLSDLGLCGLGERVTGLVGSAHWIAPEVATAADGGYGAPADVWSLGAAAIEMATTLPPAAEHSARAVLFMAAEREPPALPRAGDWSEDLRRVLGRMLVKDPRRRATPAELLEDPWLAGRAKGSGAVLRRLLRLWEHHVALMEHDGPFAAHDLLAEELLDKPRPSPLKAGHPAKRRDYAALMRERMRCAGRAEPLEAR